MKRILILLLILLASCSRKSDQELYREGLAAERGGDLVTAHDRYKEAMSLSPATAYAESCQYRLANMYLVPTGDKRTAAAEQARFYRLFPASPSAPKMLFLAGFTYNNDLHLTDSARALYAEFLERYPSDPMAASARFELDNLGKSPDEYLRSKQGGDSAKALPK
jgi:outer membrane protein assembly factor BamD (BamD/ComL family)